MVILKTKCLPVLQMKHFAEQVTELGPFCFKTKDYKHYYLSFYTEKISNLKTIDERNAYY